jgi:hypothetical protein
LGSSFSRLPITLILALSAFCELMLNRIGTHLLGAEVRKTDPIARLVDQAGLFFFYETGFLALILFTWAAIVMIRDRNLLRIPERMAFTFLAALFVPLATMGMIVKLPKAVAPHLNTAFVLLLAVMVIGFLRRSAPLRAKLGVIYLSAPLLLHGYWLMTQQVPALAPTGRLAELPIQLFEIAEHLLVVGAFAAFLFFGPFPRRANLFSPIPVTIAALTTAGVALLVRYHYPEAVQAAYHGLGINIPPPSVQVLMHLSALFVFVLTLCALVARDGPERSTALGLVLVAISGFQLQLPYQLLLTLSGMMLLIRSTMSEEGAREPAAAAAPVLPESWNGYLPRLAAACARPAESGEAILLQNDGQQIGQVRGQRDGLPFSLRIQQGGSTVQRIEISLGEIPPDPAPIAFERRRGLRGGRPRSPEVAAPRGKLGLPEVDRSFEVHDSTGRAGALLADPSVVTSLLELCHGWLGIWPGRGLLYLAAPGKDGWPLPLAELAFSPELAQTDACEALVALLRSLARQAEAR